MENSALYQLLAPQFNDQQYRSGNYDWSALQGLMGGAPAPFEAPQPQSGSAWLPNISLQNLGYGRPQISGGLNIGDLGISGRYQKRDEFSPVEWSTMLNYHRAF